MKVIWFIVCTLILATILLPFMPEREAAPTGDAAEPFAAADPAPAPSIDEPAPSTDDAAAVLDVEETDLNEIAQNEDSDPSTERSELKQALAAATGNAPDKAKPAEGEKIAATEIDRSDPLVIPEGIPGVNAPLPTSPEDFPPGYDPTIHTPQFMADLERMQQMASESRGDVVEPGKLAGKGTEEDPYRITWDLLLMSAQTYKPREDKRELPELIAQLDGKHVRISGYMLVPLGAVEFDEALLLMNMWDGCCIGLPPTAYDAVEVMLGKSQEYTSTRALSFGTIEGILKVDPYEVSNWLVGLYIIEKAKVTEMM